MSKSVLCQNTNISGIINQYTSITFLAAGNCIDHFDVASVTGFSVGDSIFVIQMQGASIDTTNTVLFGTISNYNNAGNYEFAKINSISGNTVYLTSTLKKTYDVAGQVQMISYPHYVDATVTATLLAQAWNGSTGGVLVFSVSNTLTLNADVDVSGLGFRGGAASPNYYTAWFYGFAFSNTPGRGGKKGEGIVPYILNKEYGRAPQANGGGAGMDINTGGAGGGNCGIGGHGGNNYFAPDTLWGMQSKNVATGYTQGKIFLGGGGGGGHQNNSVGTAGTNGGGIIIISSNSITGNGHIISAKGTDNNLVSTIDGAGGGGAGGVIFLTSNFLNTNLTLSAAGGKGGNQVYIPQCHGNGGGGGGGVILYSGASLPGNVTSNVSGGIRGSGQCNGTANDAVNGGAGSIILSYVALPNVFMVDAGQDQSICVGDSIQIGSIALSGVQYQWNNGVGNIAQPFVNPSATTQYILTGIFACDTVSDTLTVFVNPFPTANFNYSINCNDSVIFSNNSSGNLNSLWNFGDGSSDTIANPVHSYLTTGTYNVQLIVTNAFGCNDTMQQNVNTILASSASFSFPNSVCNLQVPFQNNSSNSNSFLWDFGDGSTDTATAPIHIFPSAGTFNVMLIASPGNCADTTYQSITVNTFPVASFTDSSGCGLNVSFFNTSTSATSYSWNFGDGTTSSSTNPSHIYSNGGTFSVILVSLNAAGCSDTIQQNISVTASPSAAFSNPTLICSLQVAFQNSSLNGSSFSWNFGDGTADTIPNPVHIFSTQGIYNVMLIVNPGLCADTETHSVNVGTFPVASFNDSVDCNLLVSFINQSSAAVNSVWDFGDGNTNNTLSPSHAYAGSGTYLVTLIISNSAGCSDTLSKNINVPLKPTSGFVAYYDSCSGEITFTNASVNANGYLWNFGDGQSSQTSNPVHSYLNAGTFSVSLIASNGTPCTDTLVQVFDISGEGSGEIFIPNCFTPNGDGLNERFEIIGSSNCENYHLEIFNRWGELIFETDDAENVWWDGTYNKKQVPEGVYYYLIEGKISRRGGTVTLLR